MDDQVVVLLVIVGAGLAILMGWAATHRFYLPGPKEDTQTAGNEFSQVQYMREVRLRNMEGIAGSYGYSKGSLVCTMTMP